MTEAYGYGQDEGFYNASHTNSLARSNCKRGVYSKTSNADYVKKITRKRKLEIPQTQLKVWDTYNAIVQSYNSHE